MKNKNMAAIHGVWSSPNSVETHFVSNAQKFEHLSDAELSKHAEDTRKCGNS